jgi:hypothetical protein
MTHRHLPRTYALARPKPVLEPELERLVAAVLAAQSWLVEGLVSS